MSEDALAQVLAILSKRIETLGKEIHELNERLKGEQDAGNHPDVPRSHEEWSVRAAKRTPTSPPE